MAIYSLEETYQSGGDTFRLKVKNESGRARTVVVVLHDEEVEAYELSPSGERLPIPFGDSYGLGAADG